MVLDGKTNFFLRKKMVLDKEHQLFPRKKMVLDRKTNFSWENQKNQKRHLLGNYAAKL